MEIIDERGREWEKLRRNLKRKNNDKARKEKRRKDNNYKMKNREGEKL